MSTHSWKFENDAWTCTTCGHSFKWKDEKSRVPQKFDPDGSPARDDPCRFRFHIIGVLSFIDAGKGMNDNTRRKFVQMAGMDPEKQGSHAAAFEHCLLGQEMDNYAFVDQVMDE
jgi:hypothetical protein